MPKTKFQDVIFTIMMIIVMVYAMICYNISVSMGGLSNIVFLEALKELPIDGAIAFVVEFFIVGKVAKKIAFKLVDPKETTPIIVTVLISAITVAFMCPIMSFAGTLLFNFSGVENIISTWLQTAILNLPMAFFWQIFYAGPIVRFLFRKIFSKQLAEDKTELKVIGEKSDEDIEDDDKLKASNY